MLWDCPEPVLLIIQIQHLLKLNGITKKGMIHFHIDSNTTLVKVK